MLKKLFAISWLVLMVTGVLGIRLVMLLNHRYIGTGINLLPFTYSPDYFNKYESSFSLVIEIGGNILLFIPFPYCINILFRLRGGVLQFILSLLVSLFFEAAQFYWHLGFADINDFILNGMGALLGIYFLLLLNPVRRRKHARGL